MDKARHQVSGICVEFVDETRFVEERAAALLSACVGRHRNVEEPYGGVALRDREDVSRVLGSAAVRDLTPWYSEFALQFGLSIGSVEHENFGHPVACVVAISSGCADAVSKMKETFETIRLNIRNLFPEGLAPASLQAQFVLLHDDHEGPTQTALDKLRELQSTFGGQHCHLLKINSLDLMHQNVVTGLNSFLSDSDLKGLEDFAKHVTVALIVPKLLETLQISSKQLDAKKKTFSDTLATWWGGGAKKAAPADELPPGSGLKYAPTSVIALYRKVADAAFMLQYYELAYSAYRACAKEAKKTQDEWLAGCVEMATICSFFTNSAPREFEADLEKAVKFYAACPGLQRFSLRCSLLGAALCRASRNYLRAGAFFADYAETASSPLVAALLQEQASLCLLYLDPPRFRRLAFRLVFAARKFIAADHYLHALRCYRYAEGVYRGHEWRMIDDHLHYNLARQLASHGRVGEALELFQLLLCDVVASKDRQASYLRELMFLAPQVRPQNAALGMHFLAMPLVEQASARMISGSRRPREGGRGSFDSDDDLSWVKLEKELLRFGTAKSHRRSVSVAVKDNRPNDCAVGEPAFFEVKLNNPLAIHLQLSAVTIVAYHEPLPGQSKSEDQTTYDCESYNVFLTTGSSTTVRLKILPIKPGLLKVRGLRCMLFDTLPVALAVNPPILRSLRQSRTGGAQDESRALDLSICSPMPLLECEFSGPSELLSGQVVKCSLKLFNAGKTEMRNVRIKTSHPAFVHFDMRDDREWPMYGTSGAVKDFSKELRDFSVWEVPIKSLGPGASVNVVVWLRGASVDDGMFLLRFLMYYEPLVGGHRLFRFATPLKVHPLLRLTTHSWPMPGSVDSHVVGLSLHNVGSVPVSIDQISCGSFQWAASHIDGLCDLEGALQPGHVAQLGFKVAPRHNGDLSMRFHSPLLRNSVRELNAAEPPLFSLLERECSEIIFSGPEDLQVDETFSESALQLAVLWTRGEERGMLTAADVSPFGDSSIALQAVARKPTVVTPGAPQTALPLRFGLVVPKSVEHDFEGSHLCVVAGAVVFYNATGKEIAGVLQAHPPPSGAHSRMCYFWTGLTLRKFCVQPHSSLSLPLGIGFNSAGTYNIDRFSILVDEQVIFPSQGQLIAVNEKH